MRKFIIGLMIIQIALFCIGVNDLIKGDIKNGLFIVVINIMFFVMNVFSLKKLNKNK